VGLDVAQHAQLVAHQRMINFDNFHSAGLMSDAPKQ
jgi:hypothetical protein